ncbi:MBL fold metallo-hydrolase [Halococcus hamelinensis]|uniref:Beta-lactamase n=1 Tax=Halococcus hamelinensis 100A6 TaxID=1132509 RepID=M0M1E8_9EURY|nr:MBL fold metallo-hydrolase [Halococcus hamelinensis]EMA38424.1 beta-lactamase [Halococcus hamelinensis 100A6]
MTAPTRVPVPVETAAPGGETNAYVLGEERTLLVDPAAATPALDEALGGRAPHNLLVTHTHPDHVGGVAAYADDATVWARAGYVERFERATGVTPDRVVRPGTTIETDAGTVEVDSMPGHAPDHLVLAVDGDRLVGDLAVATGSVVVGRDDGDMRAYLTALRRLHARDPDRLYPGHGPVIDDPRTTLERLIRHRLQREKRVQQAVSSGARTLDEVTDAVYEKDISDVRRLAEETVGAHLEKLAVEGALAWDGERANAR